MKNLTGRVHRRDKGVRRITAFMLWAKHVRKDVIEANPRSVLPFPTPPTPAYVS